MFTGIINGCGSIREVCSFSHETRVTIEPLFTMTHLSKGESISVNGVCLTVEKYTYKNFTVYVSPTTLKKTNLGKLKIGNFVNLERAISLGDRLSGHIVTGHVDCIAQIQSIKKEGKSHHLRIVYPPQLSNEIVSKGSIAVDGISLTVVHCDSEFFDITIIPTTWKNTTISYWVIGAFVNIETDILGKYIHKMVSPLLLSEKSSSCTNSTLTLNFLHENGFF